MKIVRLLSALLLSFLLSFPASSQKEEINIGFLIPDRQTTAARDGAALAVEEANRNGGYSGKLFHLVVRSVEGMWGTGSKQAVSMIFDYDVAAIVASLDGRNAHLAEQITTKTKVAFVSTRSTDMTLSYAFVPWYFRCIPDDKQQAKALIGEVYRNRGLRKIVLVGEDSYDAEKAMNTFIRITNTEGLPAPQKYVIKDLSSAPQEITLPGAEAYILFGTPALAGTFLKICHRQGSQQPLFGTISLLDDGKPRDQELKTAEEIVLVSPELWFTEKGKAFEKAFIRKYGYTPGPVAAYAYDGVGVIIEAIRKTGTNRNRIIGYLSGIRYTGATGTFRFDEKGNRAGTPHLMILKNGVPAGYKVHP